MTWSGLLIYWATNAYNINIGKHVLFHFFPKSFYDRLNIPFRLADGMAYHFLFMWFFAMNGFCYVVYTWLSGEWRFLLPRKGCFRDSWHVLAYDLHLRKLRPEQGKYNAAQQLAYTAIIVMGFGSLITGLAIYKPVQFSTLTWLCGGYHFARIVHFGLTIGYVMFFLIHVFQVILAGWNNFRSMVSGFEVVSSLPKSTRDKNVFGTAVPKSENINDQTDGK
jgi:thiosulfate reductase cytochrome b subunit